jgi:hypothetical protein
MNPDNSTCQGVLKQQNVDSNGMYVWEEKYFRLHINKALLEAFDNEEASLNGDMSMCTQLSFVGSKHAKEWSLMTPSIGSYGFDVVWSSGRIWSFLADDEFSCRKWVESINRAISVNPLQDNRDRQMSGHDDNIDKHHSRESIDRTEETFVEPSSPPRRESSFANAQPTTSKYNQRGARSAHSVGFDDSVTFSQAAPMKPPAIPVSNYAGEWRQGKGQMEGMLNISAIPMVSSRSPSDLSPESGDDSHKLEEEVARREAERDRVLRKISPFDMTRESQAGAAADGEGEEKGGGKGGLLERERVRDDENMQLQLMALMRR